MKRKTMEPEDFSTNVKDMEKETIEVLIRRKLLTDGDGSGDDRRVQIFNKSFLSFSSSTDFDKTEDEKTFRILMLQIQQMEYSAMRTHAAIVMNTDSLNLYDSLQKAILEESKQTQQVIDEAKKLLAEQTRHRKNSIEYEVLYHMIQRKPDRKASEERRTELYQTLKKYSELREKLVEAVDNRERHIKSLRFAIESLRSGIDDDDTRISATAGSVLQSTGKPEQGSSSTVTDQESLVVVGLDDPMTILPQVPSDDATVLGALKIPTVDVEVVKESLMDDVGTPDDMELAEDIPTNDLEEEDSDSSPSTDLEVVDASFVDDLQDEVEVVEEMPYNDLDVLENSDCDDTQDDIPVLEEVSSDDQELF